jgi:hypothetical protein
VIHQETTDPPTLRLVGHEQHVQLWWLANQGVEAEQVGVLIDSTEDQVLSDVPSRELDCGDRLGVYPLVAAGRLAQARELLSVLGRSARYRHLFHGGKRSQIHRSGSTETGTASQAQDDLDRTRTLLAIPEAANADAAEQRFAEFEDIWDARYPALIGLWRRSWEHFVMFLRFPPEIRKIVYTTNVIESLNSRFRQATRRRGHFPNEEADLKVLYLVIRDHQPNRSNPTGRTYNWKEATNTLTGFYGDRVIDNQ